MRLLFGWEVAVDDVVEDGGLALDEIFGLVGGRVVHDVSDLTLDVLMNLLVLLQEGRYGICLAYSCKSEDGAHARIQPGDEVLWQRPEDLVHPRHMLEEDAERGNVLDGLSEHGREVWVVEVVLLAAHCVLDDDIHGEAAVGQPSRYRLSGFLVLVQTGAQLLDEVPDERLELQEALLGEEGVERGTAHAVVGMVNGREAGKRIAKLAGEEVVLVARC